MEAMEKADIENRLVDMERGEERVRCILKTKKRKRTSESR